MCFNILLPKGVFNVVTGNGKFGSCLATHSDVDKVGFTGSTEVCINYEYKQKTNKLKKTPVHVCSLLYGRTLIEAMD